MTATLFNMIHNLSEFDFGKFYRQSELIIQGLKTSFSLYLESLEELDDDTFWSMIDELRTTLLDTVTYGLDKTIQNADIELGCGRFAWEYAHGKKSDRLDDLLRFAKTYQIKKGALYRPLFDTVEGFGDDGYGDLIDSFPLWGRERYTEALTGYVQGNSEEQYQGENYITSRIEEAAFEKFATIARYKADESESEEIQKDAYYVHQNEIERLFGLSAEHAEELKRW